MEEQRTDVAGQILESEIYAHEAMYLLREPVIRSAIEKLVLPAGSRGLDAGCAIGLITQSLSSAVSPGGHVTGLDLSSQYLDYARARISELNLIQEIAFREGDVNQLPFDEGSFDWAWSMDTPWPGVKELGCPSEDPFSMVRELARVVRPGGTLAILFWTSQKLLPGYPLLEARLSTTSQATAPFAPGMNPEQHVLRGLSWLREAGLVDLEAQTFVADVIAPLDDKIRDAMIITFPMFWGGVEQEVSKQDWAEYNRLCQPESPDFILDNPDYYAFHTYTMFQGRVAR